MPGNRAGYSTREPKVVRTAGSAQEVGHCDPWHGGAALRLVGAEGSGGGAMGTAAGLSGQTEGLASCPVAFPQSSALRISRDRPQLRTWPTSPPESPLPQTGSGAVTVAWPGAQPRQGSCLGAWAALANAVPRILPFAWHGAAGEGGPQGQPLGGPQFRVRGAPGACPVTPPLWAG